MNSVVDLHSWVSRSNLPHVLVISAPTNLHFLVNADFCLSRELPWTCGEVPIERQMVRNSLVLSLIRVLRTVQTDEHWIQSANGMVCRTLSLLISSGSTVRFSKTSVLSGRGLFSDETGGDEFPDEGAFAQDGTTNKKLELRTKTNSFADIFYLQYY